ncbi:PiggyBac transposable element-derived protein [Plakobranchus ocellatus]|uniref:PiggyBac transposable element-derived protein n=1 Tax=Plakobranchus ocellatus TaxID=259542 RepID=A0AAV4AFX5_9GAST|nr:PiggyBac transposable element-derived protein [Plakobranchus ocellatus]
MDVKCVHLVSNFHSTEPTVVKRKLREGNRADFPCPKAIQEYNQNMGGVDKADMLCSLYGVSRKSKKWWHRLFFGLIDRTMVNAFIVFSKVSEGKLSLQNFLRSVALSLVTLSKPPKMGQLLAPSPCPSLTPAKKGRKGAWSVNDAVKLEQVGLHYDIYKKERGSCEICSSNGVQSRPHSKCHNCNVCLCSNEKIKLLS